MFTGASSFNQDLCPWAARLPDDGMQVKDMFVQTDCGTWADPDLEALGPFCYTCASTDTDGDGDADATENFEPQGSKGYSDDLGDNEQPTIGDVESSDVGVVLVVLVGLVGVVYYVMKRNNNTPPHGMQQFQNLSVDPYTYSETPQQPNPFNVEMSPYKDEASRA
jgi:hypothetical protein